MKSAPTIQVTAILFSLLAPAQRVTAQGAVADSFEQLRPLVRPGDTVTVTDPFGNKSKVKSLICRPRRFP